MQEFFKAIFSLSKDEVLIFIQGLSYGIWFGFILGLICGLGIRLVLHFLNKNFKINLLPSDTNLSIRKVPCHALSARNPQAKSEVEVIFEKDKFKNINCPYYTNGSCSRFYEGNCYVKEKFSSSNPMG